MKPLLIILGVILIVFGIAVLGYKGFTYTTQDKVAKIGDINLTVEKEKAIYFTPMTGVLSLVAGVFLVVISRKKP